MHELVSRSAARTESIGEDLAARLEPGNLVLLEGDLATGKTTLVRGLVRGLGGDDAEVTSPTFVLVQSYPCPGAVRVLHHVDLYRLADAGKDAFRELGLEELLSDPSAVVAVEWPHREMLARVPAGAAVIRVLIRILPDGSRGISITGSAGEHAPVDGNDGSGEPRGVRR